MTTNSATYTSFTREDLEAISVAVMADPGDSPYDFLSACASARALTLATSEHGLPAIPEEQLEDEFDDFLDENYDDVMVAAYYQYSTSNVLKKIDPVAYRQMFLEYADTSLVKCAGMYFKTDELLGLNHTEVLETLASHCVERFGLDDEVAEDLGSANTPAAFVTVLKRLLLTDIPLSASAVVSQDERRRM